MDTMICRDCGVERGYPHRDNCNHPAANGSGGSSLLTFSKVTTIVAALGTVALVAAYAWDSDGRTLRDSLELLELRQ